MSDRDSTQQFTIKNALINHCGKSLTPSLVDQLTKEVVDEMRAGPTAWAFKEKSQPVADGLPVQRIPLINPESFTEHFEQGEALGFNECLDEVTPLVARLQGENKRLDLAVSAYDYAHDALSRERDALQSELTKARELLQESDDFLYMLTGHDHETRFLRQHGKSSDAAAHDLRNKLCGLLADKSAPAEPRIERGMNHGFDQSRNSCRHDHRTGVWWREGGVTRTGRECDACGSVKEDPFQPKSAAKPEGGAQ